MPTIPYLRVGDPREWVKPEGYVEPARGEAGYSETYIERDLLEDDPPWLLAESAVDFAPVADAQRPRFFRTEAMWPMELSRAHVILSAQPIRPAFFPALPPAPFRRYRVALVRALPGRTFAARAGGWVELATLWLVRDKEAGEPGDRLLVQQREFHDLAALVVEPRIDVGGSVALPEFGSIGLGFADSAALGMASAGDAFIDQVQAAVDNILVPTASVEFWTV